MKEFKHFRVDRATTLQDLKQQRNILAKKYHPDVSGAPVDNTMAEIQQEYDEILKNFDTLFDPPWLVMAKEVLFKTGNIIQDERALMDLKQKSLLGIQIIETFSSGSTKQQIHSIHRFVSGVNVELISKLIKGETK